MKKSKLFGAAALAGISALAGFAAYKINKQKKTFSKETIR